MSDHTHDPKDGFIANQPVAITPGQEAEFLEILCRTLDVQVSILDQDLRYRLITDSTYKNLKVDKSELKVGDPLTKCHEIMTASGQLTPEIIERSHLAVAEQMSKTTENVSVPTLVKLGDGSTHRHVRKTLANGYVVAIADDVSQLVEKDQLLDEALTLGNAGYWTYDFQTKDYWLCRSMHEYFKESGVERILKNGMVATIHVDDRPSFIKALRDTVQYKKPHSVTCRSQNFQGRLRWVKTSFEIINDEAGKPQKLRAFVKDVTRERQKEEELKVMRDEAVSANLAKTEFLANMSHEIRTPMNGIMGMVELLTHSDLGEREKKLIRVINNSSQALLSIINDILDFSKIEAGAMDIDPHTFNLKDTLEDVTAMLRHKALRKGLKISLNYPDDAPQLLEADAGRLRQVVTNLVGNAIKFTDKGSVTIDVKTLVQGGNANIQLVVVDTGIGVAQDKLARIFEKFTQADGSTTRIYGGTGLGLTISKRIIDMMGGEMITRSIEGKGSAFGFHLTLPISKANDEAVFLAEQTSEQIKHVNDLLHPDHAKTEILVAEDFELNRSVLELMLEDTDYTPVFAENGQEAVELFQTDPARFPLIFMDVSMPIMDGYQASAAIRKFEAELGLTRTPIIALTGHALKRDKDVCLKAGMDDFLSKPVKQSEILAMVAQHLAEPERMAS